MHRQLLVISCIAIACGGKSPPPQHSGDEHHGMPPELARFHDVLAPNWHAEKGPARTKATCDAIGDFRTRADEVAHAAVPAGADGNKWAEDTKLLVNAVGQLGQACTDAHDTFELAFTEVHTSFEALLRTATQH
jgi:hypothetical protein